MDAEQRAWYYWSHKWEVPVSQSKPFALSSQAVWSVYKKVKANKGSAGVDGQSVEVIDKEPHGNLYKLWN
jgi:retron-type reverse transcriptase